MALNDFESSAARGQPVYLVQFIYGPEPADYYAYTDGESEVTHDSVVYSALPLTISKITAKGKMERNEVRVVVPRDSDVAEMFRVYPPTQVVTIRIRQGHIANSDDPVDYALGENFPVAWLGRVLEASREGAESTLTCELLSASMKRPGLRRHYQWPCPLALYGSRCQADEVAATTTATVGSITGNAVTLNGGWLPSGTVEKNYVGGSIEWVGSGGTEKRMIMKVESNVVYMAGPPRGLEASDSVSMVLGCGRHEIDCAGLHNNAVNYGGHPFIPTFNPVGKNNHT